MQEAFFCEGLGAIFGRAQKKIVYFWLVQERKNFKS
jgi:hypothetical protein